MKAKMLMLCAALLLAASATAYAADSVKAVLSKSLVYLNNQLATPGKEYAILNYNNRIYVPLRFVSEKLGYFAGYDSKTKAVYVDGRPGVGVYNNMKSAQASSDANEDFRLRLFSDKTKYAAGEPLAVWARIERTGEGPLTIMHAPALVYFHIEDKDGYREQESRLLSAVTSTIRPEDDWLSMLPPHLIVQYKGHKMGSESLEELFAADPRPAVLPKGTYRIGASAEYGVGRLTPGDAQKKLTAEITITVE